MGSNPLKGEISFNAGDEDYTLVFTIDALISLEERYDKGVAQLGEMLEDNLRMADLRAIFHAGLAEHHPILDEKAAGRIMGVIGIAAAADVVGRAFSGAFGVEEAATNGAARPRASRGTGRPASTSGSTSTAEPRPTLDA